MSLFSSFVPISNFNFSLNWVSSLTCLMVLPGAFWLGKNYLTLFYSWLMKSVNGEMAAIHGDKVSPGTTLFCVSLFSYLMLNNFLGLLPYVFTSPSHLTFTLSVAFPMWVGHMVHGAMYARKNMLAHLVPLSTPNSLIPLMVLIEMTSSLIRPLTLAVRLAANMVAGHLLFSLISQDFPILGWGVVSVCFIFLFFLMVLEMAVSVIQAYVFSLLMTLYLHEVESIKTSLVS